MEKLPETPEKTKEELDEINRALGHYGLYSIEGETYLVPEHPEDERWL